MSQHLFVSKHRSRRTFMSHRQRGETDLRRKFVSARRVTWVTGKERIAAASVLRVFRITYESNPGLPRPGNISSKLSRTRQWDVSRTRQWDVEAHFYLDLPY